MTNLDGEILITNYEFELVSPACHPGSDSWSVKIHHDADLSALLLPS